MSIDFLALQALIMEYLYEISVALIIFVPSAILTLNARRKAKKALRSGDLREEVILTAIIIDEDDATGKVYLKPRTAVSAEPIRRSFPNSALVDEIIAATKRCDDSATGSFIQLKDPKMHRTFMKRVVDMVSELGGAGHIARACGGEYVEYIVFVCVTFSMDGPHRKIRIDVIAEHDLPKFSDEEFVKRITNRPEEGSHADLAAILQVCAGYQYGDHHPDYARTFVRRASVSVAK